MSEQDDVQELRELIESLDALLNHRGWTDRVLPKVKRQMANVVDHLLSDIGDTKGQSDFQRGQAAAYKWMLTTFYNDLRDLKQQLAEAEGLPLAPSDALPPV